MYTDFEEFNAFVYYQTRAMFLDGVIWCLGPYVDDSRDFGWARIYLAHATRALVRRWCRIQD